MEVPRRKRAVVAYLAYQYLYNDKKRKFWTHPLVSARLLKGAFSTLFEDLKEDPFKFFNYFRMSIRSFNELADKLEDALHRKDTVMRLAVRPVETSYCQKPVDTNFFPSIPLLYLIVVIFKCDVPNTPTLFNLFQ